MDPRQDVATVVESANHQLTRVQLFKRALTSGDTVRLQELLSKEPQLKRVTSKMLWHAVLNDQLEIASMLLNAGADPNARKPSAELRSTILHEIVKKGDKNYDQLALLAIRCEANARARDEDGSTPLDYAVRRKSSIDVIRELVKRGARAKSSLVVEAADHADAVELVALLVGEFVDANTMERQVDDALRYCGTAIFHESQVLSVVKILLDMKRLVGRTKSDRWIVLQAMYTRKVVMAQLLLEHGFHMDGLIDGRPKDVIEFARPLDSMDEVIIRYLTLTICKGKTINDCDLEIIRGYPGMHTYHTQCLEELKKMKAMKIANNVSFFSILKNVKEMPFLTRNSNIVENYMEVQRKDEFPIYRGEMDFALQSATMRKRSLRERENAISQSLENTLPFIPLERVIYYFYLNEIK